MTDQRSQSVWCARPDQVDQLLDAGKLTPDDAAEVRTFVAFLRAAGPPPGRPGHDRARLLDALRTHYPDDYAAATRAAGEGQS